jgi:hypothetical protein
MSATLPELGSIVMYGRTEYRVVRHGCATRWDKCPHGDRALTVERADGKGYGTECLGALVGVLVEPCPVCGDSDDPGRGCVTCHGTGVLESRP